MGQLRHTRCMVVLRKEMQERERNLLNFTIAMEPRSKLLLRTSTGLITIFLKQVGKIQTAHGNLFL